ncbi:hypothetical protein VPH35_062737 [Triticum aestivum]
MSMHAAAAAAGARVKRRLEPTMICFSEEPALAEAGYRFAMRVTCNVKQSLEFRRSGQRPDVLREKYIGAGNGSTTTFPVGDLSALQSDSACRGAVRCMLAELPQLRSLHLADGEWDSVVPADIVRQIVRVARGDDANDGFTFCFAMKVHLRIIYNNKALLMGREPGSDGIETDDDCPICLDSLEGEPAVELPHCKHAFHRGSISTWFCNKTTCPLCVGDVRPCVLPEFPDL